MSQREPSGALTRSVRDVDLTLRDARKDLRRVSCQLVSELGQIQRAAAAARRRASAAAAAR